MTATHSLSRAEFDAIAAGHPDAAIVGKLLTGLLSKRMLILRAIHQMAEERCPDARSTLDAALRLLDQVQSEDRTAVRAVLTHPSIGAWAARCLRRLQGTADSPVPLATELGYLAAIAAATAIRAGHSFSLKLPLRDGAVMLPTLGLASFYGMTVQDVTVTSDGSCVSITADSQAVTIPSDPAQDADGWLGLRSLRSRAAGTSMAFDLDDLDPARYSDANALCARLDGASIGAWQSRLDDAWEVLATQYPQRAEALAAGLRCIVPLRRKANGDGTAVTLGDAFGGISMTAPPDALRFADSLIHEFHHSVLYALMTLIPLHSAGPRAEHYSPWRDDPRPFEGVLHGAYAYLGVVELWLGQRGMLTGADLRWADFEFARWRHEVIEATEMLRNSGQLTAAGMVFVSGMAATASRWLDLPVDEEAQSLADRVDGDHRLRWRLRNRHPDADAIEAVTSAWLGGYPCPADPLAVPVAIAGQLRRKPLSDRARLCGLRLRNPDAIGQSQASAGDIAYVRDDFALAIEHYHAAIQDDPNDTETWAGLALTQKALDDASGVAAAPEVARAVYLGAASRGSAPDITALDRWLARPAVDADQAMAAIDH